MFLQKQKSFAQVQSLMDTFSRLT